MATQDYLTMAGPGPFELPLCGKLETITIGEAVAMLHFDTLDSKRIDVPVPLAALPEIGRLMLQAAEQAAGLREGSEP